MENNNRLNESLKPLLHYREKLDYDYMAKILTSSCDKGVIFNNGKNGAKYAPKSILSALTKFNNHLETKDKEAILISEVHPMSSLSKSLESDQKRSSQKILKEIKGFDGPIIHIGGGHDHAYPLLMAIQERKDIDNILILNIDAHCDTRIDDKHHSGTPFRNFDRDSNKPFHIIQFGIESFSNAKSTLTGLAKGSSEYLFMDELKAKTHSFSIIPPKFLRNVPFKINKKTAVFFSLDCDGIDGSQMKAVSCSNPNGLSLNYIKILLDYFIEFPEAKKFYGLYEFNPVFEDNSLYATKTVAALIHQVLKKI